MGRMLPSSFHSYANPSSIAVMGVAVDVEVVSKGNSQQVVTMLAMQWYNLAPINLKMGEHTAPQISWHFLPVIMAVLFCGQLPLRFNLYLANIMAGRWSHREGLQKMVKAVGRYYSVGMPLLAIGSWQWMMTLTRTVSKEQTRLVAAMEKITMGGAGVALESWW